MSSLLCISQLITLLLPLLLLQGFFPVQVQFTCSKTFCHLEVEGVTNADQPVKHTEAISLAVEEFRIV